MHIPPTRRLLGRATAAPAAALLADPSRQGMDIRVATVQGDVQPGIAADKLRQTRRATQVAARRAGARRAPNILRIQPCARTRC